MVFRVLLTFCKRITTIWLFGRNYKCTKNCYGSDFFRYPNNRIEILVHIIYYFLDILVTEYSLQSIWILITVPKITLNPKLVKISIRLTKKTTRKTLWNYLHFTIENIKKRKKIFFYQSWEKWRNYTYARLFDLIANTVVPTWNNQNVVPLTKLKCIPCSVDFL